MDADGVRAVNRTSINKFPKDWGRFAILCLFPCLLALVLGRTTASPPLKVTKDRPNLVFREYMIDAGPSPVPLQTRIRQSFFFRNAGEEIVRIKDLVPSCGCLKPEMSRQEIPAGETGEIVLPIETRNEPPGIREYTVTIRYEDPVPRETTLTYRVNLPEKKVTLEPRVLMVMGRTQSTDRDTVTIADHRPERRDSPMHLSGVTASSSFFTAAYSGYSAAEGFGRFAIEVNYPSQIPQGQQRGVITAFTDDPQYPALQIPVLIGTPKRPADEPVRVSPESVRLAIHPTIPADTAPSRVKVMIPAKWQFSHLDVWPSQIHVKEEVVTPEESGMVTLEIVVSVAESLPPGVELGTLTLNAKDGEDMEMVTIPITMIRR